MRAVRQVLKREKGAPARNRTDDLVFISAMNKLILTLSIAAFATMSPALIAQEGKPKEGREGRGRGGQRVSPEERLKRMTDMLSLNQEQQDKIKAIMEENREKFQALRDVPENERREKGRELFQAQTAKINEVLTPEQKEKWKAEMEKRRAAGERGGKRGGGEGAAKSEEKK